MELSFPVICESLFTDDLMTRNRKANEPRYETIFQ